MCKRRVKASLMLFLFTIFYAVSLWFSFISTVKAADDELSLEKTDILRGILLFSGKNVKNNSPIISESAINAELVNSVITDPKYYFSSDKKVSVNVELGLSDDKTSIKTFSIKCKLDRTEDSLELDDDLNSNTGEFKSFVSTLLANETLKAGDDYIDHVLIHAYFNRTLFKLYKDMNNKSEFDGSYVVPVYMRILGLKENKSVFENNCIVFPVYNKDNKAYQNTQLYSLSESQLNDFLVNLKDNKKTLSISNQIAEAINNIAESRDKNIKSSSGSASGALENTGNGKQALDINKINQDDMDFNYIDVSLQAAFSQYKAKGIDVTGTAIKPGKKHNNKKLTFYDLYKHNIDISKKKYNGASLSAISFKNNYTLDEVFRSSNDEIDKLKDVSSSDKGPIQHIMLAPLIKYIYATMGDLAKNGIVSAGAIGTQQGSGDNANAEVSNVKKYYSAFENILKTVTEYEASSSPNFDLYKDQFGTMRHIKTVTNAAMYLKPMITLENTLNYVKSLNGWEEKDDNGKKLVHNKDLDKAISEASTSTDGDKSKYFTTNSDLAILAQVVKNVKEAMDYMGIKPFDAYTSYMYSDEIYNALKDINFLQKLANYDFTDDKQPLKVLFDTEQSKFSSWYLYGSSLSSWYIPLKTNSYKPQDVLPMKSSEELTDWLTNFHVKYGFYRKALYIDTNLTSTTDYFADDNYMPNKMRIATLRDLTEYKKDNLLYIDDNFYNADSVMENFTRSKSAGDIIKDSVSGAISGAIVGDKINNDFAKKVLQQGALNQEIDDNNAVLKNKGYNTYLDSLLSHAKAYGEKTPVLGKLFDIFEHLADGQQIFSDSMDV